MHNDITDVPGIIVGHAQDECALTGCTVILCGKGAVGGVHVGGSAPGTRETDLLRPGNLVNQVHAVLLTGGSAFGLDAAAGVMKFLESRGIGFETGAARVPIVPAAVIYDLGIGNPTVRPDARMGEEACVRASCGPIEQGNVGAGIGATVGKVLGPGGMMKGGLGSASMVLDSGVVVGALVVVNAFGDVYDPDSGKILAGALDARGRFVDTTRLLTMGLGLTGFAGCNTTIGVVATDAPLDKASANKVAQMAHDGLARTIRPVHTMFDGDAIFCLSTGLASREKAATPLDITRIGIAAVEVTARAVMNAVMNARSVKGVKCARDILQAKSGCVE